MVAVAVANRVTVPPMVVRVVMPSIGFTNASYDLYLEKVGEFIVFYMLCIGDATTRTRILC